MKYSKVLHYVLLLCLLASFTAGCRPWLNEIRTIHIFKTQRDYYPPPPAPTSGWTFRKTGPHPSDIQKTFNQDDTMYVGLVFNQYIHGEIYLSGITTFNVETGDEEPISVPADDLGPFDPGDKCTLGFMNPWPVPDEAGTYELRLYADDKMIASALFVVN